MLSHNNSGLKKHYLSPQVLIILFSSIGMFVTYLFTKSFWCDEILSYDFAARNGQHFIDTLRNDYHPPLYFIILKGWMALFGQGELSGRIFQLINGLFLLSVTWGFFKRTIKNNNDAILLLALFAFSAEVWLFVPMLRYYAFATALVILSTSLFLRWIQDSRLSNFLYLVITYLTVLYTDYPAAIIIVIHFFYLILTERKLLFKYLGIISVVTILFIPWLFILAAQLLKISENEGVSDFNGSPLTMLVKIVFSFYAFIAGETIFPFEPIFIIIFLIASVLFLYGVRYKDVISSIKEHRLSISILLVSLFFTAFILTYVSTHNSFIYAPSRTLFALPFFYVVVFAIVKSINKKWVANTILILWLVINIYSIINITLNRNYLNPGYASPWKEVMADIKENESAVLADEFYVYDYYRNSIFKDNPPTILVKTIDSLKSYLINNNIKHLYVLTIARESTKPLLSEEFVAYINNNCEQVFEKKYLMIDPLYNKYKSMLTKREGSDSKFNLKLFKVNKDNL